MKCIECLHHWLGSGIVAGVLTAMNINESIVIDEYKNDIDFSGADNMQLSLRIL